MRSAQQRIAKLVELLCTYPKSNICVISMNIVVLYPYIITNYVHAHDAPTTYHHDIHWCCEHYSELCWWFVWSYINRQFTFHAYYCLSSHIYKNKRRIRDCVSMNL